MSIIVSISCITYNHASYIRECLDSFLMQKTSFSFEVVIYDDASTDGTAEILEEYASKYPDIFFPLIQKENQWSQGIRGMMARFNFPRCRGEYIAICEGDDYWTDPFKLQKQFDFLELNKKIVFCFHNAKRLDEKTNEFFTYIGLEAFKNKEIIPKHKLFLRAGGTYPTASAFFRKYIIEKLPSYFYSFGVGDTPLLFHALTQGEIGYLSDAMCVYRTTETNWSSHNAIFANKLKNYNININAYTEFDMATHKQYKDCLKNTISHLTYQVVYAYCQEEKGISNRLKFYFKYQFRMNGKQNLKSLFRIINS